VMDMLRENRGALDRLSDALMEYASLDGKDVDLLIAGEELSRPKPERRHLQTPEEVRAKDEAKKAQEKEERPGILDAFPPPEPGEA